MSTVNVCSIHKQRQLESTLKVLRDQYSPIKVELPKSKPQNKKKRIRCKLL